MLHWKINLTNNISISSDKYTWNDIPNLPIISIDLYLPNRKIISFEGFEKYLIISTFYHFVKGKKGKLFDSLNILGKKKDDVCQISFHRKGQLFQCKNKYPYYRPLIIKTFPKKDKTEKKRFVIEYSKPIITNINDWKEGLWMPKAKVELQK